MSDSGPAGGAEGAAQARGPGARLRRERERRTLGTQHVAEALHVDVRLIEAMEADHFGAFDAPVYARGFLRKYAGYLDLPGEELLAAYAALAEAPVVPTLIPVTVDRSIAREWSRFGKPAAVIGAVLVVGGSYWWIARTPKAPAASTAADAAALRTGAPTTPPAAQSAAAAPPPSAERSASARLATAVAPPTKRHEPSARAAPAAGLDDELVIKASGESWVEVYAPTGARLFFDLVRDGETHRLPGPGPWRVFLGNADGIRLSVGDRNVVIPEERKSAATARIVIADDGAVQ
jgi:cytoskeleton protein RodZ